jgi:hypothetical protein
MSRLDDIVTALATRYADATVSFEAGKLVLNKHAQRRKVILVRQEGQLKFSAAPDRAPKQPFERFEMLEATLRAEDEDELDQIFDRFVNTVFEVFGPNAFEDVNEYSWFQADSSAGGDWARRNPAIKLQFRVRLRSIAQPGPFAVVAGVTGSAVLTDPEGATGPTADFVAL